jgi:RNA-binding protein NOB1
MIVIQWSKKTGDYSVLSHPDLCVLALTYALHEEDRQENDEQKNQQEESPPASLFN